MTALRRSMIEALPLRGLSARTQERYVRAVRQLAQHFHQSPPQITEEERRQPFLHLKHVRQSSRRATTRARCGIKFVCEHTRTRAWTPLTFVRPPREKYLPVLLSIQAVRESFRPVRLLPYRTCLTTIYSCGVRLQEGTQPRVTDSDSPRRLIPIRHGKGGQDRDVPLPHRTLELLRQSWVTPRTPLLIFPAPGRGRIQAPTATKPLPQSSLQAAFRDALKGSGVNKLAGVHPLRQAWATHLLAAGVNLRLMHADLGHNAPTTTAVSTPLPLSAAPRATEALTQMLEDL